MHSSLVRSLIAVVVTALLYPAAAGGDAATEARIYFQRGVELARSGRNEDAAERFLESDRLAPNPNAVFNAASCFERIGALDEAFALLSEYRDRVAGDAEAGAAAQQALESLAPRVAQVRVASDPPGATIFVDRRALGSFGVTPRTLALPEGEHSVRLELAGYAAAELQVEGVRGERREVEATLVRRTGRLAVDSEPSGAVVRVEGREPAEAGLTPLELELPAGEWRVAVELDGRRPELRVVSVPPEGIAELQVALVPLPPPSGRLVVSGNVAGAVVLVDGTERGFTPVVLDGVPVGVRRVTVRTREGLEWSGDVEVRAGEGRWVSPEFRREEL